MSFFMRFFKGRPKIQKHIIKYAQLYGRENVFTDYIELTKQINRKFRTQYEHDKVENNVGLLVEEHKIYIKEVGDGKRIINYPVM